MKWRKEQKDEMSTILPAASDEKPRQSDPTRKDSKMGEVWESKVSRLRKQIDKILVWHDRLRQLGRGRCPSTPYMVQHTLTFLATSVPMIEFMRGGLPACGSKPRNGLVDRKRFIRVVLKQA